MEAHVRVCFGAQRLQYTVELGILGKEKEQRLLNSRAGLEMRRQVQRATGSLAWPGSQCEQCFKVIGENWVRWGESPMRGKGWWFRSDAF